MSPVRKARKRPYRSPQRQRQAEATRQRLIASARRLFAQKGYSASRIEAIALEADVSVQTFYAVFGSKRALLLALLDTMETDADIPRLSAELREAGDPRQQIQAFVDFGVRLYGRAADVLEIIRMAGMAEKDLGALWSEGEKRRRLAQRRLVREWRKRGAVKPGLEIEVATDILWAMTGPDSYRLLVRECGWGAAAYSRWLAETTAALLLR